MAAFKVLLFAFLWQIVTPSRSFCTTTYKLKAQIEGLSNNSVIIRYALQGVIINDTILVRQSRFTHSLPMTDGGIATLIINSSTQLPFWLESPLVSITGSMGSPPNLKCKGTPENDLLELYRTKIERPYKLRKLGKTSAESDLIVLQEYKDTRQFIEEYPSSITAAYLLYWQAVYDTTSFDQFEHLIAQLSSSIKSRYWIQKTITRIANVRNRPRIGNKLPAFSLLDATGKTVTLASFAGQYVLLDFWGTWCVPCIQGIPELKTVQAKFGSRLSIVSIALERPVDRNKWLQAIEKYGMNWVQTAEFRSAQDGVIELYNIKEYPTFLLADPEGILIAKIKYGEVESQIDQILNR